MGVVINQYIEKDLDSQNIFVLRSKKFTVAMTENLSRFWPLRVLLLLLTLSASKADDVSLDNGLGTEYHWLSWKAVEIPSDKPLMVIIHRPGCPACKSLKTWFSQSQDILTLSRRFSMVNFVSGTEEAPQLEIDGAYVHRIYFLDGQGQVLDQVVNQNGNPEYKFFYFNEESVIQSMKTALESAETDQSGTTTKAPSTPQGPPPEKEL